MKKNHELEKITCPDCGSLIDAAIHVGNEDSQPSEGDITVCAYCSSILIFTEPVPFISLSVREATRSDLEKLDTETLMDLKRAKDIIIKAHKLRKK